ncbi:MAG: SEC-C domain-containing protein [Proteobacteria bacterium]|nr:SEC-C domain-containing protein [Pseudomonadota bacterium]
MSRPASPKRPAIIRVQTQQRASEMMQLCDEHGVKVIVGIEPDKPEDISDVTRLLHPFQPVRRASHIGRNESCPCGSGRKFKKCCLRNTANPPG